jgi:hypothetical protein
VRWGEEESTALTPPKPASRSPARRKRSDENDHYKVVMKFKLFLYNTSLIAPEKKRYCLMRKWGVRSKGPATQQVLPDMKGDFAYSSGSR